jgi:predicted DNA binding CopG/RHH family protein
MEKPMSTQKIPQTDSVQELAQFWDAHDLTDFEDQLEESTEPVFEREAVVRVRLQPKEVEAVKEVARLRGIDYLDLIREWVLEKVHTA